ncbi:CD109 antigen-like [Pomacea canaliculata]|uniref:CD109 antigen-like n=1 Tax=Pomacea canaliculata TaxID=400727 RepID=UPI000D72666A|nr:CD109 antigen-like [Pomacea canaliculata]
MKGLDVLLSVVTTVAMITSQVCAEGVTYRVTLSYRMRAGKTLPVSVHLLRDGDVATVTVTLVNVVSKAVIASAPSQQVRGGETPYVFKLPVPADVKNQAGTSSSSYEVRVKAIGDVNFDRTAAMTLEEKSFSIFVQTDKAIYKPGQTVMIRALAMNPDLTLLNSAMDILIKDPAGNVIRQWKNIKGGNTGVVELSMPTSTKPPLGNWAIDVSTQGHKEVIYFSIEKYDLPKFETILEVPKKVLTSDGIKGIASAKYTFGKPVAGADVNVVIKLNDYLSGLPRMKTFSGKLNGKGQFEFQITNQEIIALSNPGVNKKAEVIATVTDESTRHRIETNADIDFEEKEVQLAFLPISPDTFKPGLPSSAYLSVTKYDGTLLSTKESIAVQFEINTKAGLKTINKKYYPSATGLLRVDQTLPKEAESVTIKATSKGVTLTRTLQKAFSPSDNFIKVTMYSKVSPKVGESIEFSAFTTEKVTVITYQVYAKGVMVDESAVFSNNEEGDELFIISIEADDVLAPSARLVVFYFREDGEVVADSISFKVEGFSENPVSVTYSKDKVKAGEDVTLVISAKPGSSVFLLGVDKSVRILEDGNDITQEKVTEELASYDYVSGTSGLWQYVASSGWPYSIQGSDAKSLFKNAEIHILTDGDLSDKTASLTTANTYNRIGAEYLCRSKDCISESYLRQIIQGPAPVPVPVPAPTPAPASALAFEEVFVPVEKIRSFFPERWLWSMITIGSNGIFLKQETAPDTITTWVTTAFAVHLQYGLSVLPQAVELTTFQDLFVTLDLPYSVIRGEDICLRSFAFNYQDTPLQMRMTLGQADGINNVVVEPSPGNPSNLVETRRSVSVTQDLGLVESSTVQEVEFCFTPTKLGEIPIRINLTSSVPGDGVEYKLLVEPEGSRQVQTVTVLLEARPNIVFTRSVPLNFPSTAVQGSQVITVKISGNLLVSIIANLNDLLRLPYGCGEQNMIFFAPNVFLINYLQRTNTYTPALAHNAEMFMLTGYQREITFQHTDGSFSAFGNRDSSGSMWLTAFVTKCFVQAVALKNTVVTIDPKTIISSIKWMIARQDRNGPFPEPGNVIHKEIQGGSAEGDALTAFVLISLAEASNKFEDLSPADQQSLQNAITKARMYLERRLKDLSDSYDLAIVTYAFHLVGSSMKDAAFQKLLQKAITSGDKKHWERHAQSTALNIEMTSYTLLTYVLRGDVQGGLPILRWLLQLRGPNGGFQSTQDTVVGLQALAEMAAANHNPVAVPFRVTVSWTVRRSGVQ